MVDYEYTAIKSTVRNESPKDQTLIEYEAYMNRELP